MSWEHSSRRGAPPDRPESERLAPQSTVEEPAIPDGRNFNGSAAHLRASRSGESPRPAQRRCGSVAPGLRVRCRCRTRLDETRAVPGVEVPEPSRMPALPAGGTPDHAHGADLHSSPATLPRWRRRLLVILPTFPRSRRPHARPGARMSRRFSPRSTRAVVSRPGTRHPSTRPVIWPSTRRGPAAAASASATSSMQLAARRART